ncbi:ATP-binding protein [Kocuria rhizosphaericola]|uniref:ATP-binding protein n=1 Tax=Kocuria rhizosphaericola TaxID=3376284 RepID=UPI00379FB33C
MTRACVRHRLVQRSGAAAQDSAAVVVGDRVLDIDSREATRAGEPVEPAGLLANARKHTPPGTAVTAAVRATPDGGAEASVLDTGPGIPPAFRARLFERFRSGDVGGGASLSARRGRAGGGCGDRGASGSR